MSSSARTLRLPSRDEPLPAVDERLVAPETRAEIIDGKVYFSPPADEEHGRLHVKLATVLQVHLVPGYVAAVDMLTRTSKKNDFAPDASVFLEARDPETGGRRLEEFAFEIASRRPIGVPAKKARELVRRGVRRVFCLLVKKRQTHEWSREADRFLPLVDDARIEDRCFARPLPVRALFEATEIDQAIVDALVARGSPAIEAIREQGFERGFERGLARGRQEALLLVLRVREIPVDIAARARVEACDDAGLLERWATRALRVTSVDEVFEDEVP